MMNNRKAFTLIELIMVIAIVGLLAGIGGPLTLELMDSFGYSIDRKDLSQSGDVALRRMGREIPRLQDDTSVVTANATTYRFVDIDGNTIEFGINGTNLERFDGTNTDVLAANVSSFSLSYLDRSSVVIVTPLVSPQATDIRYVNVDLTFSTGGHTNNYHTRVRLRNVTQLKDLFS